MTTTQTENTTDTHSHTPCQTQENAQGEANHPMKGYGLHATTHDTATGLIGQLFAKTKKMLQTQIATLPTTTKVMYVVKGKPVSFAEKKTIQFC